MVIIGNHIQAPFRKAKLVKLDFIRILAALATQNLADQGTELINPMVGQDRMVACCCQKIQAAQSFGGVMEPVFTKLEVCCDLATWPKTSYYFLCFLKSGQL